MVDEILLQYIWKYQLFDKSDLRTTEGYPLSIYSPGVQNHHAGPDFGHASIRYAGLNWHGPIEIHIKSSYWKHHGHEGDPAYSNTILHVVWQDDAPLMIEQERIPTLELSARIDDTLVAAYRKMLYSPEKIACHSSAHLVSDAIRTGQLHRASIERLEHKSLQFLDLLSHNQQDWEETTYQWVGRTFGIRINQEPFQQLCESTPLHILRKQVSHIQRESLLFGMAGFLEEGNDDYQETLRQEFLFLARKYNLKPRLSRHHFNAGRLRPASLPSLRIAQFCHLLSRSISFHDLILHLTDINELRSLLHEHVSPYWQTHYDFAKKARHSTQPGRSFIDRLIINGFLPVLAATSRKLDQPELMDRTVHWMSSLKPEINEVTRLMRHARFEIVNALESQGAIHLYSAYCQKKRCLTCNIGATILNKIT